MLVNRCGRGRGELQVNKGLRERGIFFFMWNIALVNYFDAFRWLGAYWFGNYLACRCLFNACSGGSARPFSRCIGLSRVIKRERAPTTRPTQTDIIPVYNSTIKSGKTCTYTHMQGAGGPLLPMGQPHFISRSRLVARAIKHK